MDPTTTRRLAAFGGALAAAPLALWVTARPFSIERRVAGLLCLAALGAVSMARAADGLDGVAARLARSEEKAQVTVRLAADPQGRWTGARVPARLERIGETDAAGTVLVRRLPPGDPAIGIRSLTSVSGVGKKVFFTYHDNARGNELWMSDGTEGGTRIVKDLQPGRGSSNPRELHAEGAILLFSASDGVHGFEPWRSDGTRRGTLMIQDIAPGAHPASPGLFTSAGAHVFFAANDGIAGMELWAVPRSNVLATFGDVAVDSWPWPFVEALAGAGLTVGCVPGQYCPGATVSRAETAVFLLRGIHGVDFVPPPATGTVFTDVPAGYWAAPWIEQLAQEGLTSGCGQAPPTFCPTQPLKRDEMAVFLLRAKYGSTYTPPPATGTVFADVPASYWAAPWIERLSSEGITAGCGGGSYCPDGLVTRAPMAAFLSRTFALPLP